jgi:AraC-like DNA-binding protein
MLQRLNIPRSLNGAIWQYGAGHPQYPMHRHSELEANLVTRGLASYVLQDRRYELGTGSLVWLFPGQEHMLARRTDDFEMLIFVFRPRLLKQVCRAGDMAPLRRRNPSGVFCRILPAADAAHLQDLARRLPEMSGDEATFNAGLQYVLLRAWRAHQATDRQPDGTPLHPAVRRAARWIAEVDVATPLKKLSDEVGLNAARLSHLFHLQMGMGLSDYRNRIRLRQFFQICGRQPEMTLLAAALTAGFGSYAQFHRVFSSHIGLSPREYFRQRVRAMPYPADMNLLATRAKE